MNNLNQKIWTYELSAGSITIDSSYGLVILSFTLISGLGTYTGSALANGVASTPVNLALGQAVTISSDGTLPIDGFTINTTGVIAIIGKQ
jgi:hypothetical protein